MPVIKDKTVTRKALDSFFIMLSIPIMFIWGLGKLVQVIFQSFRRKGNE